MHSFIALSIKLNRGILIKRYALLKELGAILEQNCAILDANVRYLRTIAVFVSNIAVLFFKDGDQYCAILSATV